MDRDKVSRIKEAVRTNFQNSPAPYESFEKRFGFFRRLNEVLLGGMSLPAHPGVLDVGCGTGASSRQILESHTGARVWGLDNSPAMLETARSLLGRFDRLTFVEGDAARLSEYFGTQFDAIVYSASIFLIPDYRESLIQARRVLKPGGSVGLSFMDGVYDAAGENLLAKADQAAGQGMSLKRPVRLDEFLTVFSTIFRSHRISNEDFLLPREVLLEFFSVPAMSAGLFPGKAYEERVEKVRHLFEHVPESGGMFRWALMVGTNEIPDRSDS
jgi:ubiquinone/menaquinone biosynthesis C-methylase UbiE